MVVTNMIVIDSEFRNCFMALKQLHDKDPKKFIPPKIHKYDHDEYMKNRKRILESQKRYQLRRKLKIAI